MTQVEPPKSGDGGAEMPAAAARRAWQPSSLRAARSMAATAQEFGSGMVQKLLAWHAYMSRRDESMGAVRRSAAAARRIEVHGAPMPELSSLIDREPPPVH